MKRLYSLLGVMLVALIAFTTDVPPARWALGASGVIIVTPNCATPSPLPSTGQQVTYVDANGFVCTNGQGGGPVSVTVTPSGCGSATLAATLTKPFSNGGSGNALLLVSGTASQKIHVCAVNIGPVASAVNVALIEGTTSSTPCDTSAAGLMGGSTAATGWQFAANGGLTMGNGTGIIAQVATTADNVCLLFSAGVQASGVITYASY